MELAIFVSYRSLAHAPNVYGIISISLVLYQIIGIFKKKKTIIITLSII